MEEKNTVTDYREAIRRYRMMNLIRFIIIVIVLAAVAIAIYIRYRNHVYTDYDVKASAPFKKSASSDMLRIGDRILLYGKDGAHLTDVSGVSIWDQIYEIQDAIVSVNGTSVAIGGKNGYDIYIGNDKEITGHVKTTLPIANIAISQVGRVTAILIDNLVTRINTYDASGNLIFTGEARMTGSGYPVSVALSPNGVILAITYMSIESNTIKSNVAFYNLGEVGENYNDYIVSAYAYTDEVVPMIKFMNDSTIVAVSDNRVMFYAGANKPSQKAEQLFNEKLKAVYSNEDYVGLVLFSDNAEYLYKLKVFDKNAEEVGEYYIDSEFSEVVFSGKNIIVYNSNECLIMTLGGQVKYSGSFGRKVNLLIPLKGIQKYALVSDSYIETIQLK